MPGCASKLFLLWRVTIYRQLSVLGLLEKNMDSLNDMSLEKFRLWSEQAMKVFLSVRNKSTDGTFEELAARCFCAWEEKIEANHTAELAEYQLTEEYKSKLCVDGQTLPDPITLSNWKDETSGMKDWPSVYVTDISAYLNKESGSELVNRLINEYKEGKAYRYFSCGWVKKIESHNISSDSKVCFLKSKVTPSQAVRNKPYNVWIAVRKDSNIAPGGEILSAYCTCTTGMFGTCNHIAGVLFRVEYAVKTGMTRSAGTSERCKWNVPAKASVEPLKCTDTVWKKSSYHVNSSKANEQDKVLKKVKFTPLRERQQKNCQNQENQRQELYNAISSEAQDSCFVSLMEKKRKKSETVQIPMSLMKVSEEIKNMDIEKEKAEEIFLDKIKLSEIEIDNLSKATEERSICNTWQEQRKGRITASNFHRVLTRSRTLQSKKDADASSVVKSVMGNMPPVQTKAMKHGISLEPCAKKVYNQSMRSSHKKFNSYNCGLFVYVKKPFIAASPDMIVQCMCCGEGLCEVKCPESIKDQEPNVKNVPYIEIRNGQLTLKESHQYYTQIQGQMGVLGKHYCDLFIYTFHGNLNIRTQFNEHFFNQLLDKLCWFWSNFIMPELLTSNEPDATYSKQELCKICNKVCVDVPAGFSEESVCCDKCSKWIHFTCVGITSDKKPSSDEDWYCKSCSVAACES